jgi:hypothetical protein
VKDNLCLQNIITAAGEELLEIQLKEVLGRKPRDFD